MKYLILLLVISLSACHNNDKQIAIYEDSARMFMDSIEKYKPVPIVSTTDDKSNGYKDIYNETVRKQMYSLYTTMREYYLEKAEKLK